MGLASLTFLLHPFQRAWPTRHVLRLADRVHKGEISIEEFTSAPASRGRLAPLVKLIAELLLDLKQQRAGRAELEQKIRDRIANRTDALERKIGTLQLQVTRDALTGLGNRRGLDASLARVVDQFATSQVDTCVLMMDIDHFKPLNDSLGHAAGDRLLKEIGQLVRSALRGNDHAFRCGGDEFVVLLHDCDHTAGSIIAERLEFMVRQLSKTFAVESSPGLSIGICSIRELKAPTAELLLQTADERLYAVKSTRPKSRRSA